MRSSGASLTRPADLARLAGLIREAEARPDGGLSRANPVFATVPTGWPAVDAALGPDQCPDQCPALVEPAGPAEPDSNVPVHGLMRGKVHEWFGLALDEPGPGEHPGESWRGGGKLAGAARAPWRPPLCILSHLVWQALLPRRQDLDSRGSASRVAWIGRRVWPYPRILLRGAHAPDERLLTRSLLVDPPDGVSRLWAIDLALRCPAVAVVVADGSGLGMSETRRLQLAAEAGSRNGGGGLALLARPPGEVGELSAAATRWWVEPAPAPNGRPRWTIELRRVKGMQGSTAGHRWTLEWDHAQGVVISSSDVVDRPGEAAMAARRVRADRGTARRRA